ncbi:hypothetical protein [Crystallibacter crystallopoietes]|nr:hypothetical protein [Arthrobacter crystallopoietes]
MAGFWHEPEWQAAGNLTERQSNTLRAESITTFAWHGWWYEGCPGI